MRVQDFDCDLIAEQLMASCPDDAHPALSQFFLDQKMPGDCRGHLAVALIEKGLGGHEGF
jgi:hypothetical protein